MILHVFSVFDSAVQAYMPPFFERSHGAAIRAFANAFVDPNGNFSKRPADYDLYALGTFDDVSGVLSSDVSVTCLLRGVDAKSV